MSWGYWALMGLAVCLEAGGDYLVVRWSRGDGGWLLVLGAFAYFLTCIAWAPTLRVVSLSSALVLFYAASVIAGVAVSVFCFEERLSLRLVVGICLAIAAIAVTDE